MMNYLAHHGIKGQKHGVRNAEWYPIDEWKKSMERRAQTYEKFLYQTGLNKEHKAVQKSFSRYPFEAGAKKRSGSTYIPKGSSMYRVATTDDKISDKRKYVSFDQDDRMQYREDFSNIWIDDLTKGVTEFKYETTKDLKIADKESEIVDYILDKYGDDTIKSFYDIIRKNDGAYYDWEYYDWQDADLSTTEWNRLGRLTQMSYDFDDFIADTYATKFDDLKAEFKSRGYDAILDVEDYRYTKYPLILLDPSTSIKELERDDSWLPNKYRQGTISNKLSKILK